MQILRCSILSSSFVKLALFKINKGYLYFKYCVTNMIVISLDAFQY